MYFTVAERQNLPKPLINWKIEFQVDDTKCAGWTDSRIVSTVLETALLKGRKKQQWPVGIEIEAMNSPIKRVRIYDDRDCKGDLDTLKGLEVIPFTPTAFADESPPKWGFFFSYLGDCKEAKGISLDIFAIIESAWREEGKVMLELNDHDLIIDARRV
jgi:hypothetical protein